MEELFIMLPIIYCSIAFLIGWWLTTTTGDLRPWRFIAITIGWAVVMPAVTVHYYITRGPRG